MPDAQDNLTPQEAADYYSANTDLQKFKPEDFLVELEDGTARPAANLTEAMTAHYKTLGKDWFNLQTNKVKIMELIIHEFGHFYSGDHLSERYYDGLCEIGAKLYCKDF